MQEAFVEVHEAGRVKRMPIGQDPLTIGRHGDNRLILTDNLASRFHCLISAGKQGFTLRDLNSSNGTMLNGRLTTFSKLVHGDTVTIGQTKIVLIAPGVNGDRGAAGSQVHADLGPFPPLPPVQIPAPEPEPSAPEDAPIELEPEPLPEPIAEVEVDELAEPLSDEDLIEDEPDTSPISMDEYPPEPAPLEMEDIAADLGNASDSAAPIEAMVHSLPDRSFGETDIALVSARGQLIHPAGGAPPRGQREAVDWLRLLLLLCSRSRATDIHLEPKGGDYLIRVRIDASMVELCRLSNGMGVRLSALVKVLSEVDIAQKNTIQEGHFSGRVPGGRRGETRRIDYRVSFAPSVFGQKLVIRVLDSTYAPLNVGALQLPEWMRLETERTIRQDAGMVLVCGPTGSGKTTTLYALIRGSDIGRRNVVTIEDPVEIQIEGVTQIPVDDEQGRGFSNLLRSTLRQDPDVILIGEIRDAETARIAMQAAITGHLVFSTLHTQNTVGTVFRLLDLGVEPYLVSQALHLVLAQRLVRRLCQTCRLPVKPTDEQLRKMGPAAKWVDRLFVPRGCPACMNTGFMGRRAIFELMSVTDELRDLITHTPTAGQIQEILAKGPFQKLHDTGYELVAQGIVPFDEIDRAVGRG